MFREEEKNSTEELEKGETEKKRREGGGEEEGDKTGRKRVAKTKGKTRASRVGKTILPQT